MRCRYKLPTAQLLLTGATCEQAKNSRDAFKFCLRIDIKVQANNRILNSLQQLPDPLTTKP